MVDKPLNEVIFTDSATCIGVHERRWCQLSCSPVWELLGAIMVRLQEGYVDNWVNPLTRWEQQPVCYR